MQIANTSTGIGRIVGQSTAHAALQKTNRELQKILERLSTSQRINRASDDAAGLGISEQLRTQIRGFKMASQNVSDGMAALNIADGGANETASILNRQRELALASRNDTLTNTQRSALDTEYQQLTQEVDRISKASTYNTQSVANGTGLSSGTSQLQVGPTAGEALTLPANNISAPALGISGTSVSTQAQASAAITALDSALSVLSSQRATTGAIQNRLESTQRNLSISEINTQAAESVLRDQDMAEGISNLIKERLKQETGTQVFSRYQQIGSNHLLSLLS